MDDMAGSGALNLGGYDSIDKSDNIDPLALPPLGATVRENLTFIWRWVLLGGAAGGWAGFLIGGIGGRLAMFVLRLTSSDSVQGIQSDDDFTIGQISSATFFLLAITTILGIIVGIVFVLARSQLPGRSGAAMIVLAGGTLGAATIIKPDGVDFTMLSPLPLACAMFTLIPISGAALTLWFTARWKSWWWQLPRRTIVAALPLIMILPTFFVSIPLMLVLLVVGGSALSIRPLRQVLTNQVGRALATVLTATVIALASLALVGDLAEIL